MNTSDLYQINSAWDVGLIPSSERNRLQHQRSRARKRGIDATLTAFQWYAAVAHFGGCCAYCGIPTTLTRNAPDELTLDHFTPCSLGGGLVAGNVLPCCRCCNEGKDNWHPWHWLTLEYGAILGAGIYWDCVRWLVG